MGNGAVVFNLNVFSTTAVAMAGLCGETDVQCCKDLQTAEQFLDDVQQEEKCSQLLLDGARVIEAEKLVVMTKLGAELAEASAEETAALASGNLIWAGEAGVRIASLTPKFLEAQQEHQQAVEHRQKLEKRHEMAENCVHLAKMREEKMRLNYGRIMTNMKYCVQEGGDRLRAAAETLQDYIDRMEPQARKIADDWFRWKPKEKKPVTPHEIHDRLNVSDPVADTMLEYLYVTDIGFRASVEKLRAELRSGINEEEVILKTKKNIVGRLCEELVINAFLPLGEKITTQEQYTFPDGSFTKVDMILYGLKEPLILGHGEGAGAREGGSLAIEVKSGGKQYLINQLEHMVKQAQGHQQHEISCVVCTRDIKDLSPEQEERLRIALREAGSPIYGMLPRKESLDTRCINFVKVGVKNDVR